MITPLIMLALMISPWLALRSRAAGAFAQVPMGGHAWGPVYLLIRAPLQAAIVAWVWVFTLRESGAGGKLRA